LTTSRPSRSEISVFLAYLDKDRKTFHRVKKGFWIDSTGKVREVPFNILEDFVFTGVARHQDRIFFYFLGKVAEQLTLKIYEQPSGSDGLIERQSIIVHETLVSMQVKRNEAFLISYDKEGKFLKVLRINGKDVITEKKFEIPFSLKNHLKNSSGLIANDQLVSVAQGSAKFKMFLEGNELVISIDQPFKSKDSKTIILKLNIDTGGQKIYEISAPDDDDFTSFYRKDKLYRLIISTKLFQVMRYDVTSGAPEVLKQIIKDKSLVKDSTYFREGKTRKIEYGTLYNMVAGSANFEPSILVEPTKDDGVERIIVGGYYNQEGSGVVAGIPNPIIMIATFLITHAIIRLGEGPGISRHIYLKGNTAQGFDFEPIKNNPEPSVRQVIDEYEISTTFDVKESIDRWFLYLLYKGYLKLPDGALGIYQEKRGRSKKIILLKY
jgi:hypothetical protein